MDLTRTLSHLAEANQQLAAAHNLSLTQLHLLLSSTERAATRGLCSKCRPTDGKATSKARTHTSRQSVTVKAPNRRVRKLRQVAAVNVDEALRREVEELRAEATTRSSDLEEQRLLVRRLSEDFEVSRRECESKESQLRQVSRQLGESELVSARLVAELRTFRREAEQTTRLRSKVAEQDEEKSKHLAIIDEANRRIQALQLELEARTRAGVSGQSMEAASDEASSSSAAGLSDEFKKELLLKREARQRAIAAISSEIERSRRELEAERKAHSETARQLLEEQTRRKGDEARIATEDRSAERVEALRLAELLKISDEISADLWLQLERTDDLRFKLENDPEEHRLRISSLERLSEDTRDKLRARKQQVNALKDRLAQILVRLGDRAFLEVGDHVREEVERQAEDIARSRAMSDERSRILAELRDHCFKEVHELRLQLDNAKKENANLEEDLQRTDDKMEARDAEILNLESQLGLAKADCRELQNQMTLINNLFTQMLLSASSAEMDLDRLTRLLQENHDLISGMAKENGSEAAALPKLLIDIIEQVDGRSREAATDKREDDVQEENIAHNLPKVWRVLTELLSCHAAGGQQQQQPRASPSQDTAADSCYKSVDTPTGPRLVISVSKTYIRLKELILEKKHLEKEMNRMKQLNSHLENKLSEQEKRLSTVADELSKTWGVVGRMQAQHQQLHTHEKILRYELQQKRKMLQELKKELEYCKEKWESARQKNNNTEMEWRSLRREFAARKALAITHADSFNNSGESGFSDDREEESDEDEDSRVRASTSRRRSKKAGSRAETPETESELPTDNECSEPKSSTSASGQRTPTPETEAELERSLPRESKHEEEMVDPLEKALSNVLQNLISSSEVHRGEESSLDFEDESERVRSISATAEKQEASAILEKIQRSTAEQSLPKAEATLGKVARVAENASICLDTIREEVESDTAKTEPEDVAALVSVFSIGPHPPGAAALKSADFDVEPGPEDKPTSESASLSAAESQIEARAARLRSLEEQAEWLVQKVHDTNRRGNALYSRLEELHEAYASSMPVAPPMPDVLPAFRIRTEADELSGQPPPADESTDETP